MKKCIIVHGWAGVARMGWHGWLAEELQKRGWKVICPQMTDKDVPRIDSWTKQLSDAVANFGGLDENAYFVGHSIGCQTIIRFLEEASENYTGKVGGVIFVAPFLTHIENLVDENNELQRNNRELMIQIDNEWVNTPIDFVKVKNIVNKNTAIFSDNDMHVGLENKELFEEKLNSKTLVLYSRGHFSPVTDKTLELKEVLVELGELAGETYVEV